MDKKYWIGYIAAGAVADYYCARKHKGTLSEAARHTFRTDTAFGKVAWVGFWSSLSVWLLPHIWKWPKQIIDEIS